MYKILAAIFIAGLLVGCSSQATSTANGDVAKQNANSSTGPNSDPAVNSGTESSNANHTPTVAEIWERHRQKSLINAPSSGPPPAPQFRPAPENSVVSTTMNKEGAVVETRVFKNNPQIARVELTWVAPTESTLKIFLRNGRVVETKADNIENLGTAPVSALLERAGIKGSK